MKRDGMVFYRSFKDALDCLEGDEKVILIDCILSYGLDGLEPDNINGPIKAMFNLIKPQIEANNRRYDNGIKGGRPKKITEQKPNGNQDVTKTKPNETETQPKEKEKVKEKVKDKAREKNIMCISEVNAQFEPIWQLYPVKKGKGQISDKKKRIIVSIGQDHMKRAIDRYLSDLKKDEWRKPQNGNTFFNSGYIDYLDENYTPCESIIREQKKTGSFCDIQKNSYNFDAIEDAILKKAKERFG